MPMYVRSCTVRRLALVALTALIFLAGPARAAEEPAEKPFEEPGISYLERRDPYIEWIAGAVLAAACISVAFKNPHRTHLD
jgi:hypothetical protein